MGECLLLSEREAVRPCCGRSIVGGAARRGGSDNRGAAGRARGPAGSGGRSHRGRPVKVHPRQGPGGRVTDSADLPEHNTAYAIGDLDHLRRLAAGRGPAILDPPLPSTKMRQVYALLGLVKRWGPERVEAACARALEAEAVSVSLISRMIERATETAVDACRPGHGAAARPARASAAVKASGEPTSEATGASGAVSGCRKGVRRGPVVERLSTSQNATASIGAGQIEIRRRRLRSRSPPRPPRHPPPTGSGAGGDPTDTQQGCPLLSRLVRLGRTPGHLTPLLPAATPQDVTMEEST